MCLVLFALCGRLQRVDGHAAHSHTLHAVNRPHVEHVDKAKISSDCNAIKAESLSW